MAGYKRRRKAIGWEFKKIEGRVRSKKVRRLLMSVLPSTYLYIIMP